MWVYIVTRINSSVLITDYKIKINQLSGLEMSEVITQQIIMMQQNRYIGKLKILMIMIYMIIPNIKLMII